MAAASFRSAAEASRAQNTAITRRINIRRRWISIEGKFHWLGEEVDWSAFPARDAHASTSGHHAFDAGLSPPCQRAGFNTSCRAYLITGIIATA